MSNLALYPLAFAAGVVSFLSPCVLPLLPGYLSYISGSSTPQVGDGPSRQTWTTFYKTLLFVAGFSIVFSLMGSAFGAIGSWLKDYRNVAQIFAGIVIIGMGLFVAGVVSIPALYREVRFNPVQRFGSLGALPLGMAFAMGWTPCLGPILSSVYMLAFTSPGAAMPLLLTYSLGLGVPFVVFGLFFSKLSRSLRWFKNHALLIQRISGGALILIGILMVTGRWTSLIAPLQRYFRPPFQ